MAKIIDWQKVEQYNKKFQTWREELFPEKSYLSPNEYCCAFAHLLSEKAKSEGFDAFKIWCLHSDISPEMLQDMQQKNSNLQKVTSAEQLPNLVVARVPSSQGEGADYLLWGGYHVAMSLDLPIYKNSTQKERLVFDPVLFDAPVQEKDWQQALNANPLYIEHSLYGEPYRQGNGFWPDKSPSNQNLSAYSRTLISHIDTHKHINLLRSPLIMLSNIEKRKSLSLQKQHLER